MFLLCTNYFYIFYLFRDYDYDLQYNLQKFLPWNIVSNLKNNEKYPDFKREDLGILMLSTLEQCHFINDNPTRSKFERFVIKFHIVF